MSILNDEEAQKIFHSEHCKISADLAGILCRAIEAAVMKKLAEQDVEPVGYYDERYGDFSKHNRIGWVPLYTETQLIAAQQKVAEACAKAVFEQAKYFGYNAHAEAVRYVAWNKWREYL